MELLVEFIDLLSGLELFLVDIPKLNNMKFQSG